MISVGCRLPQGMRKVHKNIEGGYRTGGALRTWGTATGWELRVLRN